MDVRIVNFTAKRDYKFLWLKYVTGVNLAVHCAKCLNGHYDQRFKAHLESLSDVTLEDCRLYYLCGVAADRKWAHNLHIAFTPAAGQVIDIDDGFCKIRIENARRLDISPDYIDRSLPQHRIKEFATCRNWQFANMIAKGLYPSYVKRANHDDVELEIFE